MIETCPGMKVIKEFLSPSNLSEHFVQPHGYGVDDIFYSVRKSSDFKSFIVNPLTGKKECVLDLIAFGCDQVNISSIDNMSYNVFSCIIFTHNMVQFRWKTCYLLRIVYH